MDHDSWTSAEILLISPSVCFLSTQNKALLKLLKLPIKLSGGQSGLLPLV